VVVTDVNLLSPAIASNGVSEPAHDDSGNREIDSEYKEKGPA